MNKLDLGAVTAYAMAVEQGYEGTEEEFAALQANSGNNALRAENAADRAQQILDSIPLDFQEVSQGVATLTEDIAYLGKPHSNVDEAAFTKQGFYNGNGNYQANTGFLSTEAMDVGGYTFVHMVCTTMENLSNVVFYRSDGTRCGKYTGSGDPAQNVVDVPVPRDAVQIAFSVLATDKISVLLIKEDIPRRTLWLAIGDSITVGEGNNSVSYADYAAAKLGIELNKQAVSGATISAMNGRVNNGDFDGIKPEIITVLGGTNDWNINRIAKITDTDTIYTANTYMAYLNTMIETLRIKQPQAQIIFCTCLQRNYFGDYTETRGTVNANGETLADYRDAVLTACANHGVPVIDLYATSGIFGESFLPGESGYSMPSVYQYTWDGLHPNDDGHKRIATIVANALKEYI